MLLNCLHGVLFPSSLLLFLLPCGRINASQLVGCFYCNVLGFGLPGWDSWRPKLNELKMLTVATLGLYFSTNQDWEKGQVSWIWVTFPLGFMHKPGFFEPWSWDHKGSWCLSCEIVHCRVCCGPHPSGPERLTGPLPPLSWYLLWLTQLRREQVWRSAAGAVLRKRNFQRS